MTKTPQKSIQKMAKALFEAVEADQGRGFISDGLEVIKTEKRFFDTVRDHLYYSENSVKTIRRFLNDHYELKD